MGDLAVAGITDKAGFDAAAGRLRQAGYPAATTTEAADVLAFLADEAAGRKTGQSATEYRQAVADRAAAKATERQEAAARQQAETAREFPYIAILTCGMGNGHINVLACFASHGAAGVDTELKLTNGGQTTMYKAYTLHSAGEERRDGFHIQLREHFTITAQNSSATLILGLKIVDRLTGAVLYQNQGARFDVLRVTN